MTDWAITFDVDGVLLELKKQVCFPHWQRAWNSLSRQVRRI
jgi:hypothetical protein